MAKKKKKKVDFKKKLIPLEQVVEVAQERIIELGDNGGITLTPYSMGAWSPSKQKLLDKCPLKFLLDYVLKVQVIEEEKKTDDGALRHIGTAAHSILEWIIQGMDIEEAYEKAHKEHYKDVTEEHWHKVVSLQPNIEEFMFRLKIFKAQHKVAHIFPELKLGVDKDWQPVDFFDDNAFFRGIVDLPMLMENGDIVIIDHKHGGFPEFGIRNYNEQLDTYKALFHFGKQKVNNAAAGIHFIKAGDILIGNKTPASSIEQIPNKLQVYIEGSVDQINDKGEFKYKRNSICTYCDYQPICHNGKRGTSNLLQPITELSREIL